MYYVLLPQDILILSVKDANIFPTFSTSDEDFDLVRASTMI